MRHRLAARAARLTDAAVAVAIFVATLSAYVVTLSPGLTYNSLDANELTTVSYRLGLAHSTGYPLYTWLAKLFTFLPAGDVAYSVNLLSAVSAAGACAILYLVAVRLLSSLRSARSAHFTSQSIARPAAAVAVLVFAFSSTLWSQAVIAEVYAPNLLMVALSLLLLLDWAERHRRAVEQGTATPDRRFALFALVFGLSLGTHLSNLALLPGIAAFAAATGGRELLRPRFLLPGAVSFGLALLQFAWLPLKAHELNDPTLSNASPSSLLGVYNYTLNAFPQLRWSYPPSELPGRVDIYLGYVIENFGGIGAALAVAGAVALSLRARRMALLILPAYAAEVVFFLEYRVSDLEAFFLTSHLLLTLLLAAGLQATGAALLRVVSLPSMRLRRLAPVAPLAVLAAVTAPGLVANFERNDQSQNTGIHDFYEVVFKGLPADSVLLGQPGVFGYDRFYFPLVYGRRPDVVVPDATSRSQLTDAAVIRRTFMTNLVDINSAGYGTPIGDLAPDASRLWPRIAAPTVRDDGTGATRQLLLYEMLDEPVRLFVEGAEPVNRVDAGFGEVTLVGYDLEEPAVAAGGTLSLRLYWRLSGPAALTVSTPIGDSVFIESHPLGFGSLDAYFEVNETPPENALLVESYDIVVLSGQAAGEQSLDVRIDGHDWTTVAQVTVSRDGEDAAPEPEPVASAEADDVRDLP